MMLHSVNPDGTLKIDPRPRVRIINPALAFDAAFHEALMDQEVSVLTEPDVRKDANWFFGSGGYVVPRGHLVSILKGIVPPDLMDTVLQWGSYVHLSDGCAELISE